MASLRVMVLAADHAPRPWSGIGVAVARQARALAELGLEVDVFVAGDSAHGGPRPESRGLPRLRVHSLPRSHFPVDPRGFDRVHVHSLRLADLALELRARFDLPLATTVHGWPHVEQGGSAVGRHWSRVQRRLVEASDRVVFLSRAERELGSRLVPAAAARSSVIGHGVPPPPSGADRGRRGGPVVFAGRFAQSKGVELLAALVPRVLARRPLRFVLAGGHGDRAGSAALAALGARFPDACRLAGWLDERRLEALFARAALVLVPSAYEPFGLVALEAMRMGAPVLAADTGGLRDVVGEGAGGRRLASRDPEAWAQAVLDLVDDAAAAAELSRRGPVYVARRFPPAAAARRLVAETYGAPPATGAARVPSDSGGTLAARVARA